MVPTSLQAHENQASDFHIGELVFVPFWVVLHVLDEAPLNPFVICTISHIGSHLTTGDHVVMEISSCDLKVGKLEKLAQGIPLEYLIKTPDIHFWAIQVAKWFTDFIDSCSSIIRSTALESGPLGGVSEPSSAPAPLNS